MSITIRDYFKCNKNFFHYILLFVVFCSLIILTGCRTNSETPLSKDCSTEVASAVQTAEAKTIDVVIPTYTQLPTYTPLPTYTQLPTYTLQPIIVVTATSSPTPEFTPTETNTPTITPTATKTATSTSTPNATQTERAAINATQGYAATSTKAALNAQATVFASYTEIPNRDLVTYTDNYKGEKVKVRGRVFNINGNTEFQMWLGWTYDAAYIIMDKPFNDIYEDKWVTVYGVVEGEHCGTNAYGAQICQPLISGDFYELK